LKIVHIATYINGGAGTAAYRIHEALLKKNIDSTFLCTDLPLQPTAKAVVLLKKPTYGLGQRTLRKAKRILAKNFNLGKLNERFRLPYCLQHIQPQLRCEIASLPFSEFNLMNHPAVQNADIIHLHWVAGCIDYPGFFKNNNKPIVWTLHDMNPILGLYHYKADEKRNQPITQKLDNVVKEMKDRAIKKSTAIIEAVSPSQWLFEEAGTTDWFHNIHKIPYPVNTEIFCRRETDALRKELNIPPHNTVLLFVAQSIHNYRKGFDLLIGTLQQIDRPNISLLIIGYAQEVSISNLHCINVGSVYDSVKLSTYYSLADAFILPSREDNLPNVMLESFACGTPVIAFNIGGMAEWIKDGFNGLKAEELNSAALAQTILNFIDTKDQFNTEIIRKHALDHFSENKIAGEYSNLYESLMKVYTS
jgi:glycosyltransferase involved in cell wall biosynthesis